MAASVTILLRNLRSLLPADGPADAELLLRFTRDRDEEAFAALVARHGPMVLGVCRRILPDAHAAEDAFQATFLLLSRKAGRLVRPDALAGWLHGVAVKVALNARRRAVPVADASSRPGRPEDDPLSRLTAREVLTLFDEEVQRLPEVNRQPVILCCLEGLTQDEAARRLGWTPGSVRGRLERGRRRLHERLARRGLSLSAVLAVAEVTRGATLPAGLLRAASDALNGGQGPGAVLAEAVTRKTAVGKARPLFAVVVAVATVGGAAVAYRALAAPRPVEEKHGAENKPAARLDALGDPLPEGAVARFGTLRFRHGGRVAGLALSPDGKTVATCSDGTFDPVIYLWDTATGKELRRIQAPVPLSNFTTLAFSPDGRTLASGEKGPWYRKNSHAAKTSLRLWDVTTGKEKMPCAGHEEEIYSVAFSPDGKTLASCGADKSVHLWEAATGRELHRCKGHQFAVYQVAFSPDGKTVASGGYDNLRLWDVATGNQLRVIEGFPKGVMRLAFSPDSRSVAMGSENGLVRLIEASSGKTLREFKGHAGAIWGGVAFLPAGKSLVSADREGTVRIWDVATGKQLRLLRANHDDFHHMAVSSDGKTIAAGGQGGAALFWDVASGRALHQFPGHAGSVHSLGYSPDGKAIASGGLDGAVWLWDARTGQGRKLSDTGTWVGCVEFSPDGKTLLTDDDGGEGFCLREVPSGRLVRRFAGHKGGTIKMAFSPDGKAIASGGVDELLRLWDAATDKEPRAFASHKQGTGHVAYSPNGRFLATLGWYNDKERMGYLWDIAKGKVLHKFGRAYGPVAFSPDGLSIMAVGDNETVRIWEAATGKQLRELKVPKRPDDLEALSALASPTFSSDGKYVALVWYRYVRLFELATGREVLSFTGGRSNRLAFSPDGRTIASGDGTSILTWDATGRAPDGRLREERLDPQALESLWSDLSSDDAPRAHKAAWALVAGAKQSLPFLRARLLSRPTVDNMQIRRWIAELASDRFSVRQEATDELTKLDRFAEPALREALLGKPELEARLRIERLLKPLASPARKTLAARVTHVLEQIGTAEARKVLEALAKEEGVLAREAKASLRRP